MGSDTVDELAKRAARSRGFKRTRRDAAQLLAELRTPEAAAMLASAAVFSRDGEVVAIAMRAFTDVTDQAVIDEVCRMWWHARAPRFRDFMVEQRWVASQPVRIGVVARHQGELSALAMTPDGRVVASIGTDATIRAAYSCTPETAGTPLGRISLPEVEQLRADHHGIPGVIAWYDLIIALLRHKHRHDIEVEIAAPYTPRSTDIELDGG